MDYWRPNYTARQELQGKIPTRTIWQANDCPTVVIGISHQIDRCACALLAKRQPKGGWGAEIAHFVLSTPLRIQLVNVCNSAVRLSSKCRLSERQSVRRMQLANVTTMLSTLKMTFPDSNGNLNENVNQEPKRTTKIDDFILNDLQRYQRKLIVKFQPESVCAKVSAAPLKCKWSSKQQSRYMKEAKSTKTTNKKKQHIQFTHNTSRHSQRCRLLCTTRCCRRYRCLRRRRRRRRRCCCHRRRLSLRSLALDGAVCGISTRVRVINKTQLARKNKAKKIDGSEEWTGV